MISLARTLTLWASESSGSLFFFLSNLPTAEAPSGSMSSSADAPCRYGIRLWEIETQKLRASRLPILSVPSTASLSSKMRSWVPPTYTPPSCRSVPSSRPLRPSAVWISRQKATVTARILHSPTREKARGHTPPAVPWAPLPAVLNHRLEPELNPTLPHV